MWRSIAIIHDQFFGLRAVQKGRALDFVAEKSAQLLFQLLAPLT